MTELYASLLPGGSRDRQIKVSSASVIEDRAHALTCPHCGVGTYRIAEHVSLATGVRRVDVTCHSLSAQGDDTFTHWIASHGS